MLLTGATIVDGTGKDPIRGAALSLDGPSIAAIGEPTSRSGEEVIDCTGLTITPGLIDAHVHLGLSSDIEAMHSYALSVAEQAADIFANCSQTLDAGFTTVRDTGGIDGGVAGVVAAGKVRGPRIIQCGPLHCQTGGHGHFAAEWEPTAFWDHHAVPGLRGLSLVSDGPAELRKNIRETFKRGAQFLKLCVTGGVVSRHDKLTDTQFTAEEIAVAVEEASARGTYVTVHAHNNAGVRNAVAAGVRCIEHGSAIDDETAEFMAANGVAHVPTLSVVHALLDDAAGAGLSPSVGDRIGYVLDGQIEAIRASRRAGVLVGSGSDLIGPDQAGRGRELVLRSKIETPMDALVSATSANASILGIAHEVGTVEVGNQADLVVFAGNPLDDPELFAQPERMVLVIQRGRVVKDLRKEVL